MNPLNVIAILRKFGNFLVGLFPFLAVVGAKLSKLTGTVWLEKIIAWLKAHKRLAPVGNAIERFLWKDYARDRLAAETFPAGTLTLLRVCSLATLALTLCTPLAFVLTKPAVPVELNSGTMSSAPLWAVYLWIVGASLGWGAILAGATQCHRIIFAVLAVACVWFVGSCALFSPRSYFNWLLPAAIYLAVHYSGYKSVRAEGARNVGAVLSALVAGIAAGMFLVILCPLGALAKPYGLQWGAVVGSILGLVALLTASQRDQRTNATMDKESAAPVVIMTFTLTPLIFAFSCSVVIRGGAGAFAGQMIASLQQWNGFLWPLWYFIGVGIVYKLLKNAKIMTYTVRDLMSARIFNPIAVILIVTAALIICSSEFRGELSKYDATLPIAVFFNSVYKANGWFWSQQLNQLAAPWMSWILLFDLAAIGWIAVRKQLNEDRLVTMLYFTTLSWLLIYEYQFQFSSFSQSPGHNVLVVVTFAIWLLWLFHTSVFAMCSQSTRSWPKGGRIGLYCGSISLCLLMIAARTVVKDFKVTNEIFLIMFQGIIDIGLPYFLYVLSVRRFERLPIRVLRIFQCFCAGALLTFPFNILDKLALSNWSMYRFFELLKHEVDNLKNHGYLEGFTVILPETWVLIRSLLYAGLLVAVFLIGRKRLKDDQAHFPAAIIFALLSFASGFGSFCKTSVDLPLPPLLKALVTPFNVSYAIDFNWIFSYLAVLLPGLFFVLLTTPAKPLSNGKLWGVALMTAAITLGLWTAFPRYESYLQSTNLMTAVLAGSGILFVYMIFHIVWRLESTAASLKSRKQGTTESLLLEDEHSMDAELQFATMDEGGEAADAVAIAETMPSKTTMPLIENRGLTALVAIAGIVLTGFAYSRTNAKRLLPQDVPSINAIMMLPADWKPGKDSGGPSTIFVSPGEPLNSTMEIGTLPSSSEGIEALALNLAKTCETRQVLPNFTTQNIVRWREVPGKPAAVYFRFTIKVGDIEVPRFGVTALCPRVDGKTEYFTICCFAGESNERIGDLKRVLQAQEHSRAKAGRGARKS